MGAKNEMKNGQYFAFEKFVLTYCNAFSIAVVKFN